MKAYIVAGFRTAVGKAPRGMFNFFRADDLSADVIKHLMKNVPNVAAGQIDDAVNDILKGNYQINERALLELNTDKKLFKENKSDEMKTLLKEMKSQTKTIDSLIALYIGKEDKRQGIVRNPESNVLTRIRNASRYTRSRQEGITVTENKLLQHAKEELEVAIEQTNNYYKEVWPVLKSKIEAEDTSRFKEIQELSID